MKPLRRSDDFNADVQEEWIYLQQFGEELADHFIDRVDATAKLLAQQPGLGHPGRYRHPNLAGLRVKRVGKPFENWLTFYWDQADHVLLYRVIHGARDLPEQLLGEGSQS